MKLQTAGSFWKAAGRGMPFTANDVYRISECDDGSRAVSLALGACTGFYSGFDEYGGTALECLNAHLTRSNASPPERIRQGIDAVREAMVAKYWKGDGEMSDGEEGCTLICSLFKDYKVNIGWIGSEEAFLIRDGNVQTHTEGHTMYKEMYQVWFAMMQPFGKHGPSRGIGSTPPGIDTRYEQEITTEPWRLERGDLILFLSNHLLTRIEGQDIAAIVKDCDAASASAALVNTATATKTDLQVGAAVGAVVVRVME